MRAGLMTDMLSFESPSVQQNQTGEMEKTWTECFRCRAYRKKHAALSGDEQAREEFLSQTVVFQTWRYPKITYDCRVRWSDSLWEIRLIEPRGNELTLTLRRIDE